MLVSETPSATQGDQMHQLVHAQRLGLLLGGHNCHVYERASGTDRAKRWTCNACGSTRTVSNANAESEWYFQMLMRRTAEREAA